MRKLLVQLVQQVAGKIYVRNNQRSEKMVIVSFVQSILLLRNLKISEATLSIPPLQNLILLIEVIKILLQ